MAAENPPPQDEAVVNGRLVARSRAAEMAANIAAMRELANASARRAISHHAQGRWGKLAVGKTFSAVVVLGFGLWLLWQSLSGYLALRYCGLAAVVVAGYWLAQAAVLARNVRQMRHRVKKPAAAGKAKAESKTPETEAAPPVPAASNPHEAAGK